MISIGIGSLIFLLCFTIIILDFIRKIRITSLWHSIPYFLIMPHLIGIIFYVYSYLKSENTHFFFILLFMCGIGCYQLYTTLRLHIVPFREGSSANRTGGNMRVTVLYGGQRLISLSAWGMVCQAGFYLLYFLRLREYLPFTPPRWLVITDLVFCILFIFLFLANGAVRILCTCRRLGIVKRILILCNIWIPLVNLFLIRYMCRIAREEYDFECYKFVTRMERADSHLCETQYPLIMVHGIGFRDLRYFNYWGRIPKELARNGATLYYGHQQAWGMIEENAAALREIIEQVLLENHCDKVNIIAHSKGGLDARYMISCLDMEEKVASLTTISAPHQGSPLLDLLCKLPEKTYCFVASLFDKSFSVLGDTCPDCYHSSKQLRTSSCQTFNEQIIDSPAVYYQSYAASMKGFLSDSLLSIPYLLMRCLCHEENDGLVSVTSAKWGNFRGTLQNSRRRGVSHGDLIDLKREDIKGFDILEEYVKIVSELKEMGF